MEGIALANVSFGPLLDAASNLEGAPAADQQVGEVDRSRFGDILIGRRLLDGCQTELLGRCDIRLVFLGPYYAPIGEFVQPFCPIESGQSSPIQIQRDQLTACGAIQTVR